MNSARYALLTTRGLTWQEATTLSILHYPLVRDSTVLIMMNVKQ